jgi:hypothetical protein
MNGGATSHDEALIAAGSARTSPCLSSRAGFMNTLKPDQTTADCTFRLARAVSWSRIVDNPAGGIRGRRSVPVVE